MYNNQIEKYLKAKGITKKYIADKIGMSQNGFADAIRNGTLKIKDLYSLADALDVNLCELLGLDVSEPISDNSSNLEIQILRTQISNHKAILENKDTIISNKDEQINNLKEIIALLKK